MNLVMMNRKRRHDLDFSNQEIDVYDFERDRVVSKMDFGHIIDLTSYTRASITLMADANGIYHTFPTNEVAQTNVGMKVNPAVTNYIVSSGMDGVVVGEVTNGGIGHLPTGWDFSTFDTLEVLEIGIENGLPFIELHGIRNNVSGGLEYPSIHFGTISAPSNGQEWNYSAFVKKVAGEWAPATSNVVLGVRQNSSGGDVFSPSATRVDDIIEITRFKTSWVNTADDPMTMTAWIYFAPNLNPSESVDITLRIYAPQLEIGLYANDPVVTQEGVTGVSDAITVYDDVSEFDLSVGSLYLELEYLKQYEKEPHSNDYGRFFSLTDGIYGFELFTEPPANGDAVRLLTTFGGASVQTGTFSMPLGHYKIMVVWSLTDIKLFMNGALVGSVALAQSFTSTDFEKLYIGGDRVGNRQPTAIYKQAILYDQILSHAQCVELTS